MSRELSLGQDQMKDAQKQIFDWLKEFKAGLGELYAGAIRMMKERNFPGHRRFICHAVREIRNRLPDAVGGKHAVERLHYNQEVTNIVKAWEWARLEGVYEKQSGKTGNEPEQRVPREILVLIDGLVRKHKEVKDRKQENARRLLIALEPENEQLRGSLAPVVEKWIEETEWFVVRAHVGQAVSEDELVAHFQTFETVLGTFARYFYEVFEEIEQIVEKTNASDGKPTNDEVLAVVSRLGRAKYRMHFFDKLENPSWIAPLKNAGFFENPPEPKEGESYERWPEGWYLKKMASKAPEEVLEVIREIRSRNLFVCNACIECLLEMPENVAAKGVEVVENMLPRRVEEGTWGWYSGGQQASKLMTKLVKVQPEQAFKIVWVLLDAWIPKENKGLRDIAAKFTEHDYRELVLKFYAEVWKVEPERAFWVLAKILNRCLEKLDKENEYDVSSNYYVGQGLRDLNSIDVGYGDVETVLVMGMCEAGKVMIEKAPNKVCELMDGLEKLDRAIFVRIEMYLLRFVGPGIERDRINKIIADEQYLENPGYEYEYKILLREKFDEVGEGRQVFERWIAGKKIDDLENWEKWFRRVNEREPSEEDKTKYVAGMKARQLYLVRERYPKEYEEYKNKSGLNDAELAPRRMVGEARAVSPMEGTPLQPEEMRKKKVDEVLDFILEPKNYEGKKTGGWREPAEALKATFKEDVKKRPMEYLKECGEKLANLPAGFLSGFFYGIPDTVRDGSFEKKGWSDLIEFAHGIVDAKQKEEAYRNCFSGMLSTLRDGFSERENKIEFDEDKVKKFWEIIEPLVHFPVGDRSGLGEERDPVQINCTVIAGQALELTVPLGIVCKRDFIDLWEKYLKGERRKCYEYVLSEIRQPGVNCLFGLNFARIYWTDQEWVEEKIENIFCNELWDETWGTYVSWGRPSKDRFDFLVKKGMYSKAVDEIGTENKHKFQKDPEEGLVEHLMIGFFNGWIGLDSELLKKFFEKGNSELRGKAARFLTTGFKSVNEAGGEEKEKVAKRMKEYWEKRLEAIAEKQEENFQEAVEFTGWVEDSLLGAVETLELLEKTLDLSGGKFGRMRDAKDFVDGVCELGKEHELLALRCLKKAAGDENLRTPWALHEARLVEFIGQMADLQGEDVKEIQDEAIIVADLYGRLHPDKFRTVWEKLRRKRL